MTDKASINMKISSSLETLILSKIKGGNLSFLATSVKLLASKILSEQTPVSPKPLHLPLIFYLQTNYFMHSLCIGTGISDVHTLIATHIRAHLKKVNLIKFSTEVKKTTMKSTF